MSSPFKVFRKNQKAMFAVLTVMVMLGFVVLPIVLQNFGARQANSNPVVATTTKYGDLTQNDLGNMRYRHERVLGILVAIASKLYPIDPQQLQHYFENQYGGSKDEDLVDQWLMAQKAKSLGIQISDATVTDFLKRQLSDKITAKDFQAAFDQYHITPPMFYDILREVLAVQEFKEMYGVSVRGMTPAQRWDYYLRAHRQASIQCIPVKVADFTAKVPTPNDVELTAFFEKHKDSLHYPNSPEPGFRVPQKVDIQYFKAEVDQFATPEKVTDDEIQTYYEKDQKYYDKLNLDSLINEAEKKKEPAENSKPADQTKPAENATPAVPEGEKKEPAEQVKPAENTAPTAPEGEKKESPASTDTQQGDQTPSPAADKPAEKPVDQPTDKPAEKTSAIERSPYRLASYLADDDPSKSDPAKSEAPKTDTPAPTADTAPVQEPSTAEPKEGDAKPAEVKPEDAKPAENKANETVDQTPAPEKTAPADAKNAQTEPAASPKRQLSEDVKKVIRQRVAADKIDAILKKLEERMAENSKAWKRYDAANIRGDVNAVKPPKFDFEGLAKQNGISSGSTGEKTWWEIRDLDIGGSIPFENGRIAGQQPLWITAYNHPTRPSGLSSHTPAISRDLKGDFFLYWKDKDIKESAPKWDDKAIQKDVLAAWQLEKARQPALEQAKKLAEDAKKSKAMLKEVFSGVPGIEVVTPPPFTWLTSGYDPRNVTFSLNTDVKGVDMPGEDFMKAVFALDPQGVGTAMNQPKTIAYVIQVEKFEPSDDDLWKKFQQDDINSYVNASESDMRAAATAFSKQLSEEAGLKWEKKPDTGGKENYSAD